MSRCTGHCCTAFPLPIPPPVIAVIKENERKRHAGETFKLLAVNYEDGPFIADMVVPLDLPPKGGLHWYSCRHLKEGSCSVYEDRPRMCRDYPYRGRCVNKGCTMDQSELPADAKAEWTSYELPEGVVLPQPPEKAELDMSATLEAAP